MNINVKWAVIMLLTLTIALLWTFHNAANAAVSYTIIDKTEAPVLVLGFECSGENPEAIATECRAELMKVCPNGGMMSPIAASPNGYSPPTIRFAVKCDVTHKDQI